MLVCHAREYLITTYTDSVDGNEVLVRNSITCDPFLPIVVCCGRH